MIALKVKLNGEVITIAGRDDLCVLNTIIDASGVLGKDSAGTKTENEGANLSVHVGGLAARTDEEPGEHLRWIPRKSLKVGDKISVEITEIPEAHDPLPNKVTSQEQNEKILKNQWESSRAFYLKYKEKFESYDG